MSLASCLEVLINLQLGTYDAVANLNIQLGTQIQMREISPVCEKFLHLRENYDVVSGGYSPVCEKFFKNRI